ncbi:MAG: ABC transporter permease [Lachnospiraceae bacterium]|nr:ABC transporter permease [Lachnospiraceae bacterium]
MFFVQMGKEIKVFFTNKVNLVFIFLMPILLITIFSFALRDYINADYDTFEGGKILYIYDDPDAERSEEFDGISARISDSLGVSFEEVSSYEDACSKVEASEAYGVITVRKDGYDYFRSSFNEPEGGKLSRTLFLQMANERTAAAGDTANPVEPVINKIKIEVNKPDSKNYYTFAGLAFSIMFMGLLVAYAVYDEKEYGTIERIKLGGSGIPTMIFSKVLTGILSGLVMIAASYVYSAGLLKVDWGEKAACIVVVLLCLVIFSAVFGCFIGFTGKNRTMCQSSVLMFSMLCGYLGGSITPLYLLENMPVLKLIIKISPLYYTNRAVISLYNGIVDEKMTYSILVLLGLAFFFAVMGIVLGKKVTKKA